MLLLFTTAPLTKQLSRSSVRFFSIQKNSRTTIKEFYQTLEVSEDCDDETLRLAFVNLAKRFHPDSGSNEASDNRFSEIENAYREIQRNRFEEREKGTAQHTQAEEYDIEHTAPQHRHYLMHDVGIGTPSMRQRRYVAERARKAVENVMEHRLKKIQAAERNTLVGMDKQRAKDIKTRYGMDRLVEDLIQEAMSKGEFRDLPGTGKPLKENACAQNPYVDFVTHKLNQVLIDNGFTPEWIQLSKEIREETENFKKQLIKARNRLGALPLTVSEEQDWKETLNDSMGTVKRINNKIDKYNLLVPILQKQMLQIDLKPLAEAALAIPPDKTTEVKFCIHNSSSNTTEEPEKNIMNFITSIFSK